MKESSIFEMETSALYGLGSLLNHRVITVCALIANRVTNEFVRDHKALIEKLIDLVTGKDYKLMIATPENKGTECLGSPSR